MNNITIFTMGPADAAPEDKKQFETMAEELDKFYKPSQIHVSYMDCDTPLEVNEDGTYSLHHLQSRVARLMKKSDMFLIAFLCGKEQLSETEVKALLFNLQQYKRTEIRAYWKPDDGLDKVIRDMSVRMMQFDLKHPFQAEEQPKIKAAAHDIYGRGVRFMGEGKLQEAERYLNRAVHLLSKLALTDRMGNLPTLADSLNALGMVYYRLNRPAEAESMYKAALGHLDELSSASRDHAVQRRYDAVKGIIRNRLAVLYMSKDKKEEAGTEFIESKRLLRQVLVEEDDEKQITAVETELSNVCYNHGMMYRQQGQTQEAQESLAESVDLQEKYFTEDADYARKDRLAVSCGNLGMLYMQAKNNDEAIRMFTRAYQLYDEMAADQPEKSEPMLALTGYNLSLLYRAKGEAHKSVDYFKRAAEIAQARQEDNEICRNIMNSILKDAERQKAASQNLAASAEKFEKEAREAHAQARFDDAVAAFNRAASTYAAIPGFDNLARAAALFTENGSLSWDLLNHANAEQCFRKAVELYTLIAENEEGHGPELAVALFNLGRFCDEVKGQEGNEYLRKAFQVASACKNESEAAMEVYENLEDEDFVQED
ncbi:MAG: tetratricopeptide repeat protein [Lachnospiraceae bacterium]